mmetsp:Transcript_17427/g.37838  ORF Transcript_17427/g.37838 Transcript_17427/m.37838 type:complete len:225 (+) Transcript_17427:138-812(+)
MMAFVGGTGYGVGAVGCGNGVRRCATNAAVAMRSNGRVRMGMLIGGGEIEMARATADLICDAATVNPGWIEALAKAFNTLNMPEPVVKYGHPAMMAFMVLGMGFPGAYIGWKGRVNEDKREGVQQKQLHENIMTAFWLLAFAGGFGGTLSTAMQGYPIWTSPHAYTALLVLALLTANAFYAWSGFGGGDAKSRINGRKFHFYIGVATMSAFVLHAGLGVVGLFE